MRYEGVSNCTEITKTDESIPHKRVEFEGFGVAVDRFGRVTIGLPKFPLQTVYSCSIW